MLKDTDKEKKKKKKLMRVFWGMKRENVFFFGNNFETNKRKSIGGKSVCVVAVLELPHTHFFLFINF